MKTAQDYLDGQLVLIDKPLEWTSFQVVNKLRWHIRQAFNLKKIKVGHAGTLDPLATGILPILFGEATKFSQYLLDSDKYYRSTYTFGVSTATGDSEGDIIQFFLSQIQLILELRRMEFYSVICHAYICRKPSC